MRLNWTAVADVHADYHFQIDLLNLSTGQQQVLLVDGQPMYGGAPTTQWRRGNHYTDDRLLALPQSLAPGAYRLVVGANLPGRAVEPAALDTGQTLPAMSGVLLTSQPPAGPAFTAAPVQLGQGVTLLGSRVERAGDGAGLLVTLFWSATQPLAGSETVFVHVLDAHQQLLGQHDGVPAGGALPIALWGAGITVVDPHRVSLAAPLPPGALLCVGAYDPVTLDRLDVQPAGGYDVHDSQACRPLETQP